MEDIKGRYLDNMNEVVFGFNNFFVNIGPNLTEKINTTGNGGDAEGNITKNLNSDIDIVSKCKNKLSTDWNGIDMTSIKKVTDCIIDLPTYICNLLLTTGSFPRKMKVAKVIPLYKAGVIHHFTNYRPTSLLCQFYKILERLFIVRLENFIETQNCDRQSVRFKREQVYSNGPNGVNRGDHQLY